MSWTEKDFEEKMRPIVDEAYHKVFSEITEINRHERDKNEINSLILDKDFAIDTIIHFKDGHILTFQEKIRKYRFYELYNEFTFEYYNDPATEEQGEWFKLASQLYFYGFANKNEDDLERFYILDIPYFRIFLKKHYGNSLFERIKTNKPPCRANFIHIPFDEISERCILFDSEIGAIHPEELIQVKR
jgi:hypothetical protein